MKHGQLVSEINSQSMQVMNFDTTYASSQGPFLFYFQLDYDMAQEGVVGVVLSQYNTESRSFREVALYEMLD